MTVTPESADFFQEYNPNLYAGCRQVAKQLGNLRPETPSPEATSQSDVLVLESLHQEIATIQARAAQRSQNQAVRLV